MLSRSLVSGEKFAVYIPKTDTTEEVEFFNTSNGAIYGDGYGKFVNP